jgi:hypothetical protein
LSLLLLLDLEGLSAVAKDAVKQVEELEVITLDVDLG